VTAEKWIPIIEVTEEHLSSWLAQKKHEVRQEGREREGEGEKRMKEEQRQ
jgi:hypothetical protein